MVNFLATHFFKSVLFMVHLFVMNLFMVHLFVMLSLMVSLVLRLMHRTRHGSRVSRSEENSAQNEDHKFPHRRTLGPQR